MVAERAVNVAGKAAVVYPSSFVLCQIEDLDPFGEGRSVNVAALSNVVAAGVGVGAFVLEWFGRNVTAPAFVRVDSLVSRESGFVSRVRDRFFCFDRGSRPGLVFCDHLVVSSRRVLDCVLEAYRWLCGFVIFWHSRALVHWLFSWVGVLSGYFPGREAVRECSDALHGPFKGFVLMESALMEASLDEVVAHLFPVWDRVRWSMTVEMVIFDRVNVFRGLY